MVPRRRGQYPGRGQYERSQHPRGMGSVREEYPWERTVTG